MKVSELKKKLEELDDDMEILTRYGESQVADIEIEFVAFDSIENIGEDFYLVCASDHNIRDLEEL